MALPRSTSPAALEGYRVLDLSDEKGQLCGRVLGDLGADVIKVEKVGGDAARSLAPFVDDQPHPERSLTWFFLNGNKRGITLNLESEAGRDLFRRLVATADFLVESFDPGHLAGLGLGYEALSAIRPGLCQASITHFGSDGPRAGWKGCGLIDHALGDTMFATGDPDRAPLQIGHFPQAYCHGAMAAAGALLLALHHRHRTGRGQRVDVSLQECMAWTAADIIPFADLGQGVIPRQGVRRYRPDNGVFFRTLWSCRDGFVSYPYVGGSMGARSNRALVRWMEEDGLDVGPLRDMVWEEFDWATMTQESTDQREAVTMEFFGRHDKNFLFQGALKRKIMLYPVATPKDMFEFEQLDARGFWVEMEHPELGRRITYPGPWGNFSATPLTMRRRAPLIGEHNREILGGELGLGEEELRALAGSGAI